jgi:hypothetical protein
MAGLAALAVWAQETVQVQVQGQGPGPGPNVMYIRTEIAGADKVVKGAPFSADVVTEFTQTLADGNAIRRNQKGTLARDSEGRTRREQALEPLGPIAGPAKASRLVFINDPVAGVSYVLDTDKKTAQKLPMPKFEMTETGSAAGGTTLSGSVTTVGTTVTGTASGPAAATLAIATESMPAQAAAEGSEENATESKTIEGVRAVGRKTTHTIPAGQVGNDRAIETVSERWYSPELETVILSKQNDPRMGETVYRLTNINRGEPAQALFEVPADYKVEELPKAEGKTMFHKRVEAPETK